MRNLLAALAFAVVIGLLVYNAQLAGSDPVPATLPEPPAPKVDQRRWPALATPAPAPPPGPAARDLFPTR